MFLIHSITVLRLISVNSISIVLIVLVYSKIVGTEITFSIDNVDIIIPDVRLLTLPVSIN